MNLIICYDNEIKYIKYLLNNTNYDILIITDDEKRYVNEKVSYEKKIDLMSLEFWKSLNYNKVIITDSNYKFSNEIFKLNYPYVANYNNNTQVLPFMNGILNDKFSIRDIKIMIKCLEIISLEQIKLIIENNLLNIKKITENIYFSFALSLLGYKLPDKNILQNLLIKEEKIIKEQLITNKKTFVFIDPIGWNYNPNTVHVKPLGGTQSALIYLMEELAKTNNVYLLNRTEKNMIVNNINCVNTFVNGNFNINFDLYRKLNPDFIIFVSCPGLLAMTRKVFIQNKIQLKSKFYCWHHHNIRENASKYFENTKEIVLFDKIIFVSYWQKYQYIKTYKIPEDKCFVLHNAISPYFNSLFDYENYFEKKKLKMVYTSTPDRGLKLLLDIFPVIKQYVPEIELYVYSSFKVYQINENNDKYVELYNRCRNMNGVVYKGSLNQKDLSKELEDKLILAYPLVTTETYCISAIEAMSKGCYVITSNLGGLEESVGNNGKLINFDINKINEYLKEFGRSIISVCNLFKQKNKNILIHMKNQYNYVKNLKWENRSKKFENILRHDIFINLIKKLIKDKYYEKANNMLIKEINKHHKNDRDYFLLTYSLFQQKNKKALEIIKNTIEINKYNHEYHYLRAIMNMNLNTLNYNEIIRSLNNYKNITEDLKINHIEDMYHIMAETYQNLHDFDNAIKCYNKSKLFKSKFFLFLLFWKMGKIEEARNYIYNLNKDNGLFNICKALINKPVHKSNEEIVMYRERTEKELKNIIKNKKITKMELDTKLFYINIMNHYYDTNTKKLIELTGDVYRKVYNIDFKYYNSFVKKKKIRLGFSSGFFYNHSAGKLIRGLIKNLDKNKFEIYIYSYVLNSKKDYIYEIFEHVADKFYDYTNESIINIRNKIMSDNIDILIFPEISDEPKNIILSLCRSAPIQLVHAWGHPMTTGSKYIDYVITMEGESENCEENYTEKIIKMKNLSTYFYRPTMRDPSRVLNYLQNIKKVDTTIFFKEKIEVDENGEKKIIEKDREFKYTKKDYNLPEDKNIYSCLQYLFKLNPDFTKTILKIIDNDKNGVLCLLHDDHKFPFLKKQLLEQIEHNCQDVYDRVKDRIIFLPFMEHRKLITLFKLSDVILDPFPWGGGITSFEAFAMGACPVTKPVNYLKGRFTYIMYQKMGITDCIVENNEEYIEKANRLANDKNYRKQIQEKVLEKNNVLFEQQSIIDEWTDILQQIYRDKFLTNN